MWKMFFVLLLVTCTRVSFGEEPTKKDIPTEIDELKRIVDESEEKAKKATASVEAAKKKLAEEKKEAVELCKRLIASELKIQKAQEELNKTYEETKKHELPVTVQAQVPFTLSVSKERPEEVIIQRNNKKKLLEACKALVNTKEDTKTPVPTDEGGRSSSR